MACTMQDPSEGVNLTLGRRDSYGLPGGWGKARHSNCITQCPSTYKSLFPDLILSKAEEEVSQSDILLVPPTRRSVIFTHVLLLASLLSNRTRSLVYLLGRRSGTDNRARKDAAWPQPTSNDNTV